VTEKPSSHTSAPFSVEFWQSSRQMPKDGEQAGRAVVAELIAGAEDEARPALEGPRDEIEVRHLRAGHHVRKDNTFGSGASCVK
jgi:hypothetical protein